MQQALAAHRILITIISRIESKWYKHENAMMKLASDLSECRRRRRMERRGQRRGDEATSESSRKV